MLTMEVHNLMEKLASHAPPLPRPSKPPPPQAMYLVGKGREQRVFDAVSRKQGGLLQAYAGPAYTPLSVVTLAAVAKEHYVKNHASMMQDIRKEHLFTHMWKNVFGATAVFPGQLANADEVMDAVLAKFEGYVVELARKKLGLPPPPKKKKTPPPVVVQSVQMALASAIRKAGTNARRLAQPLKEYRALSRTKQFDPKVHRQVKAVVDRATELTRLDMANPLASAPFARQPKKRDLKRAVTAWTTHTGYRSTQDVKRGGGGRAGDALYVLTGAKTSAALNRYFEQHALRAPTMPPGMFVNGRSGYLYRGVHQTDAGGVDIAKIVSEGRYVERGLMATSRDRPISLVFAGHKNPRAIDGILFRINVFTGIPRGTPWIWYGSRHTPSQNANRSMAPDEAEVLLPPGTLTITSLSRETPTIYLADATYTPLVSQSRRRRRGAEPNWNAYALPALF